MVMYCLKYKTTGDLERPHKGEEQLVTGELINQY